ncbi:hypothetical protein E2C01_012815 [Portunus trituberculatus]|uniref:Uncharacterized protein n=1 Tax=Portunus trituberculatus TaxID=210409 RepID=A0A5B7DF50_PORTR|nr:hypothetical protein [Portunus trituberculatus]
MSGHGQSHLLESQATVLSKKEIRGPPSRPVLSRGHHACSSRCRPPTPASTPSIVLAVYLCLPASTKPK